MEIKFLTSYFGCKGTEVLGRGTNSDLGTKSILEEMESSGESAGMTVVFFKTLVASSAVLVNGLQRIVVTRLEYNQINTKG